MFSFVHSTKDVFERCNEGKLILVEVNGMTDYVGAFGFVFVYKWNEVLYLCYI